MTQNPFTIVLAGRANVGKSSLFNSLLKKRKAIVCDEEGVTRERLYAHTQFQQKSLQLCDTAGLFYQGAWKKEKEEQVAISLKEAGVILMVVDGQTGLLPADKEIAHRLRKFSTSVVLVVTKIDTDAHESLLYPFYEMGFSKVFGVSNTHLRGLDKLKKYLASLVPESSEEKPVERHPKIAILGRTNTGKSTLFNQILKQERAIVGQERGLTRDALDALYTFEGKTYHFVDTAGIRRKAKEKHVLEKFASIRTLEAMEQADLCLILIDAVEGISTQDRRLIEQCQEAKKGCILLVNKWDLIKGVSMDQVKKELSHRYPYFPILMVSATTGRNVTKIFSLVELVLAERSKKLTTPMLNQFLQGCLTRYQPPMIKGKRLKVFYATQVRSSPPEFLLFVNQPSLMAKSYYRYLLGMLRKTFGFTGSSVHLHLRKREQKALASAS